MVFCDVTSFCVGGRYQSTRLQVLITQKSVMFKLSALRSRNRVNKDCAWFLLRVLVGKGG